MDDPIQVPVEDPRAESTLPTAPVDDQRSKIDKIKQAITERNANDLEELLLHQGNHDQLLEKTFDFAFDMNHPDCVDEGLTPLILATRLGYAEIVEILLRNDANMFAKAKDSESTILELALANKDLSVAELLLEKTGKSLLELARGWYQWTPLLRMAFEGNLPAVNFLLNHKANDEAVDREGDNAVNLAIMQGHLDIVKRLATGEAGHINVGKLSMANKALEISLHVAAICGETEITKFLVEAKASLVHMADTDGNSALHLAAKFGRINVIKYLLERPEKNVLLDLRNKTKETPYLTAAKSGQKDSLKTLLELGADPKVHDENDDTALHLAVRGGSLNTVKCLVDERKDKSSPLESNFESDIPKNLDLKNKSGETPLLLAIQFDNSKIVDVLLKSGANIEAKDANGNSALHLAVSYGNSGLDLLKTLFTKDEAQAKLQEVENASGETPYLLSVRSGKWDAAKFFLDHRGNPNVQDKERNTALHLAAKYGMTDIAESILTSKSGPGKATQLQMENEFGETPYLSAVRFGKWNAAKFFIDHAASSEATDKKGNTALHLAAKYGHIDIVEKLCSEKSLVIENLRNEEGESPITLAAKARKLNVLEYLLCLNKDRGLGDIELPQVTLRQDFFECAKEGYICLFKCLSRDRDELLKEEDNFGNKALDFAVENKQLEILDYLLTRNQDFDTKGMNTVSIFEQSANKGYLQLIKKLFEGCKELITHRYVGKTALHIASMNAHADVVDYLCNKGADLEAKDFAGYTALHYAVWSCSESIVKFLLNREANQAAITKSGENALHIACSKGDIQIVQALMNDRPERVRRSIFVKNKLDRTPLCVAIDTNEEDVIFQLLESENYFPRAFMQDPTESRPTEESSDVSSWLTSWIRPKEQVKSQQKNKVTHEEIVNQGQEQQNRRKRRIKSLIAWAILNSDPHLLKSGMKEGSFPSLDDTTTTGWKGANWLHLAALAGDCHIVYQICELVVNSPEWNGTQDLFWVNSIQAKAAAGITPLHIAARNGHTELVEYLLSHLAGTYSSSNEFDLFKGISEKLTDQGRQAAVLQAIIQETKQEDNLITLAVANAMRTSKNTGEELLFSETQDTDRFKPLENGLWMVVTSIVEQISTYFDFPCTENAELLIKTVLWRDAMLFDDETRSSGYFNSLKKTLELFDGFKDNHLHWAVHKKHPVAVYWLLSSGKYFTERQIRECEATIKSERWSHTALLSKEKHFLKICTWTETLSRNKKEKLESSLRDLQAMHERPLADSPSSIVESFTQEIGQILSPDDPKDTSESRSIQVRMAAESILETEREIEKLIAAISKTKKNIEKMEKMVPIENQIRQLMQNPPPVRPRKGDNESPQFHDLLPTSDHDQTATVLDFFLEENQVIYELRRETVYIIIYSDGPERLMTQKREVPTYQELKRTIFPSDESQETSQVDDEEIREENRLKTLREENRIVQRKIRWIHIPVNDLQLVQELMVRILRDKERNVGSYRALTASVRKSISELAAGGGNHFINPHCQNPRKDTRIHTESNSQKGRKANIELTACYMPYLSWGQKVKKGQQEMSTTRSRGPRNSGSEGRAFGLERLMHQSLTLDQYYYAALEDTDKRDGDQVLSRYFKVLDKNQNSEDPKATEQEDARRNGIKSQILLVDQLWLWILDDDTIITSTTKEPEDVEYPFLQRVLREIPNQNGSLDLDVGDIAQLIMDTATKLFDAQEIETVHRDKKSPLDVFRESFQHIRNQEANLFDNFEKRLKKEKRKARFQKDETEEEDSDTILDLHKTTPAQVGPQGKSQTWCQRLKDKINHLRDEAHDNPYDDILRETKLLVEVKDILDELNILRNLVEDQHHVYSLWKGIDPDAKSNRFKFPHLLERMETIKTMMEDVRGVQEAIKTLLDLKQKEATIIEAQTTRRQSDSVMVFTVVTIIFLPASFLASLFALNVDEFPHESGSVAYKGWWIFPIIFGVSLAFSLVFVPVALRANALRNFRRLWEEHKREREENKRQMEKLRDKQSAQQKNVNRPSASDEEPVESIEGVDNNPEPTQSTSQDPILPSATDHQRGLFSRTRRNRLIGYRTG